MKLTDGLERGGRWVEAVGIGHAIGGLVSGAFLIGTEHTNDIGDKTNPYIGLGIAVMVSAVFLAIIIWTFGRLCRVFAESHPSTTRRFRGATIDGGTILGQESVS